MIDKNKYFPEWYMSNRTHSKKMLKEFHNAGFFEDYENFHRLRELVRAYVKDWQKNAFLPEDLAIEGELIQKELHSKYSFVLENPTEERRAEFKRQNEEMKQSEIWKKWQDWLSRSKEVKIENYIKLEQETKISKEIINFNQNGRNIFEVSPFLINLLENTDVGNIRFKDFKLPYNSVYFHFGTLHEYEYPVDCYEEKFNIYLAENKSFETDEDEDKFYDNKKFLLDGAFVSVYKNNSLEICLCFKDIQSSRNEKINIINDHRYPTFVFTFDFGRWDKEKRKTIYDSETTFNQSAITFTDIWDNEAVISEIDYEELSKLIDEPEKYGDYEHHEYVLIDKSLKLIINSLCYINSKDSDNEIYTTNDQATTLVNNLKKAKKTQEKNRIKQKLEKFSYSKIHLLGGNLKKQYENLKTEIEVEPHWRRGHWRKQPYGKGLTETKLIWIKPTIVRKDKGLPEQGHLYDT